jgi:hypothetical protein
MEVFLRFVHEDFKNDKEESPYALEFASDY